MMGSMMRRAMIGDGSTLNVDFTSMTNGGHLANAGFTFTNATTSARTYINASGIVATATTNEPRFDHDPTTLAPRGLLIEGTATNLLNWSESFATSGGASNNWADTNITRNSTNNTDPANGTSALRVTASAGNGTIISTAAMGTSAERTFSIWLRRVSGTGNIQYTLNNGSTYTTQAITSSWVRYTFAATTAAQRVGIRIVTSGDSIELWGAQLETGSGASSYIPTGASTVQRLADNCVTAIGNLTGFNANQGTIYESWRDNTASDTTTVQEWAFAFGTSGANGCGVFVSNAASGTFGLNGGVSNTGDAGPAGTYVIQGLNKAAIAINVATTSLRLSANGSAVSAGTNILGYNGAQTFALGQRNNNSRYLNGWISQFKYWPYVLPDAQLTTLTTL